MVENNDDRLDNLFHALSDRTRRAMLTRLSGSECTVTELAAPFRMSLAAVSKHLGVLEDAGLVEKLKEGRTFRCRASLEPLGDANRLLDELAVFWQARLDALDELLNAEPSSGENEDGKRTSKVADRPKSDRPKNHPRKKRKGV